MPLMQLKMLVLPAPLGPMMAKNSPALDLEAHPGQGGHAAEAQVQVVQSEKSHTLVHPLVTKIEAGSGLERTC